MRKMNIYNFINSRDKRTFYHLQRARRIVFALAHTSCQHGSSAQGLGQHLCGFRVWCKAIPVQKTKKTRENLGFFDRHLLRPEHLEAPPGIGPGIKVLQTSALPLGYGAINMKMEGTFAVKTCRKLRLPEIPLPETPAGGGKCLGMKCGYE